MKDKKLFLQNEINITKAKMFDYEKAIKEEEKRLFNLYGALEAIKEIEENKEAI